MCPMWPLGVACLLSSKHIMLSLGAVQEITEVLPEGHGTSAENEAILNKLKKMASCGVCFEPLSSPACATCGHVFCFQCLVRCADMNSKCPACRSPISRETIHPIFF
eukprot:EC833944.1.p3 GENE.EC833944.1~~EC833944.1.p3  ORF type:complete len:107 (+),score=7.97 EC833944.1:126-446(+)